MLQKTVLRKRSLLKNALFAQEQSAVRALARKHKNACIRYARYRERHGFDLHCRRLLDHVQMTRSMLLTVMEDLYSVPMRRSAVATA